MCPDQIWLTRHVGRLSIEEAAALCGVSPRTWRRYENGQTPIPVGLARLLSICAAGTLPGAGRGWDGWRIFRGELLSPERVAFTPGEIRSLPYLHALVRELRGQLMKPACPGPWAPSNVVPFRRDP